MQARRDNKNGHPAPSRAPQRRRAAPPSSSFFGGPITLREVLTVISIVIGVVAFYFTEQTSVGERINKIEIEQGERLNKVEQDINQRVRDKSDILDDRISKLETREAVVEQHQIQTDASVNDNRNALNTFSIEIRNQLGKIGDQISAFLSRRHDAPTHR
jgi:hypothetical protein